jgi:hypothetical protein
VLNGVQRLPSRAAMVMAMSSLITTNGHYQVDLRWWFAPAGGTTGLPHDPDFDAATPESIWDYTQGTNLLRQSWIKPKPECYSDVSDQKRADPALVSGILKCSETDPLSHGANYMLTMWYPTP